MPGNVTCYLAAACGVADVHDLAQVEVLHDGGCVGGVMVHVVAVRDLGGSAVAAAVMRDDPEAALNEEQQLSVPVVGAQGPAVVKHDGRP